MFRERKVLKSYPFCSLTSKYGNPMLQYEYHNLIYHNLIKVEEKRNLSFWQSDAAANLS